MPGHYLNFALDHFFHIHSNLLFINYAII
jgi:hypothetical protein